MNPTMSSRKGWRPTRALVAIAGLILGITAISAGPAAGAVPSAVCVESVTRIDPVTRQPTVVCTRWSTPPGNPTTEDPEGGEGGEDGGEPSNCWWELYPIPDGVVADRPPGVSDQAVMYWEICLLDSGGEYVGPGGAQWFEPDQAPTPTPAQVATQLRVEVAASLHDPVVAADPEPGQPAVIDVPTFVAVDNWQGEQVVSGCDPSGTVCVTITATPELTFAPGEPGADAVACAGAGTRYDRAGAPPDGQARAAGACAYAYTQRTGVEGRPDVWTASATITWDVSWQEQGGGEGGTFAAISATEPFDRPVQGLRTVVVDTD